eukprot:CAMPEP_0195133060 /NCGR_PEP_ID=MMETSP0448-20130528/148111_1 /TAXON_ID=66468 /ORGANISM="Heterocapsa triquestra, Strain CCMP 448" /LENGTH=79 /DNA_ID=CAMNT_0040171093 /DNA_START=10 /DNA_END=246 /DNA_ORIENTATION=+
MIQASVVLAADQLVCESDSQAQAHVSCGLGRVPVHMKHADVIEQIRVRSGCLITPLLRSGTPEATPKRSRKVRTLRGAE